MKAWGYSEYILEESQPSIPRNKSSNDIERKGHLDELQGYYFVESIPENQSEDPGGERSYIENQYGHQRKKGHLSSPLS